MSSNNRQLGTPAVTVLTTETPSLPVTLPPSLTALKIETNTINKHFTKRHERPRHVASESSHKLKDNHDRKAYS